MVHKCDNGSINTHLCYHGNRKPSGHATGMKLGGKGKDVDSFVDQIRAEGIHETIPSHTQCGNFTTTVLWSH